uniref:Ubiquitin carboxyl-terminal hydrolase 47 n=3 Tax=Triatoma infestans TaxID=30076 RepID=A0A023F0P2_TRIIF
MVCVTEESRVQCVVLFIPVTSEERKQKYEITLVGSTPVKELINSVAKHMKFEPNSFQLRLQSLYAPDKIFTEKTQGSLEAAGFNTEPHYRNSLMVEGIGGSPNMIVSPTPLREDNGGEGRSSQENFSVYQLPNPPPAPPHLPPASPATSTEYSFSTPLIRHETGYVGLVNQAMTCYLNSLLQALYMTPEFRNALYKWKFDESHGNSPAKCIPFQLQKLFLNLQTSSKTAVETTELTRSFGWESGEVWQQHDIQELCRVMFDALEYEFKETEQADLINRLYQGKMIDYVKCLECGREKSREDTFLDIPLPVRPFGSSVAYGSIEEALKAFVQPEILDGNNQYFCESCDKKCNAHKGLKFSKFPYLLTLHLKRFDFDYNSLHRIKLNDKVIFPKILDLNNFINLDNNSSEESAEVVETSMKCDDSSTADSALEEETNHVPESHINEVDQEDDEGIDLSSSSGNHQENERSRQQAIPNGPFVYELYSIMIHSGSASGGHYYAYIKDFAKDEWYCFNDQSVTTITQEDIEKTFGGGPPRAYYSGAYSSSTNAYMLMYRQIDKELNCLAMKEDEFPSHIKKVLEEIKESEEHERASRARRDEMVRLTIHTIHPVTGARLNHKIFFHNDNSLAEVLDQAYITFKFEGVIPKEQCRLVSYVSANDHMEVSFEAREYESIREIMASLIHPSNEFFLETREKNKIFLPYSIGDMCLIVYQIDVDNEEVISVHQVRTSPCDTLLELKKVLSRALPLPSPEIHVVLCSIPISYLSNEALPLNKLISHTCNRIFICPVGPEGDLSNNFENAPLYKCVKLLQHVIVLHFLIPDNLEDTLERLLIPPLEDKCLIENSKHTEALSAVCISIDMNVAFTNGINVGTEEEIVFGNAATSDQSASEDSSLTDSERTIIGDEQNDCLPETSDSDQLSSPEAQTSTKNCDINGELEENWDIECEPPKNYYFRATPYVIDQTQKAIRVVVDKHIDVATLKSKLERYVGVAGKYMRLTRGTAAVAEQGAVSSMIAAPVRGELSPSLIGLKDDDRVSISFHRVLEEGEHLAKLYHFNPNLTNQMSYLCDWILYRGKTIGEMKKAMLKELEKRHNLKIPLDRLRLRLKSWKTPGRVLLDNEEWTDDGSSSPTELCVEALDGPEEVTAHTFLVVFTRKWSPSTLTVGPYVEVALRSPSVADFTNKLSEISKIPAEHIKFAFGNSMFPCEMPLLSINDLDWEDSADGHRRLNISVKDGNVVFYKDDREELKTLTKEEQLEVSSLESSSHASPSTTSSYISGYSPRKEKALKIYLDTPSRRARSVIDVD